MKPRGAKAQQTPRGRKTFAAELDAQRAYVRSLGQRSPALVVGPTFLRTVRRSGYLTTASALYELVDNAIEAKARQVHVIFGFGASTAKPTAIAVIDDGHGMDRAMLPVALSWGGTHREDSRSGFGRFGYGLPTASVSLARRVSLFSRPPGEPWHRSAIDVDQGRSTGKTNDTLALLRPKRADPPDWLVAYMRERLPHVTRARGHGSVVLLENLDGVEWRTAIALQRNLDQTLGTTYRNYLGQVAIYVQGQRVTALDPLFLTPGARYYDLDADRAVQAFVGEVIVRNDTAQPLGKLHVRAAYFPPTFARVDKSKEAVGLNANPRFAIMKENNGLIVLRKGRQLDVVTAGLGTQFLNNDRYWAIEVDFSPELDEIFALTANKLRVVVSDLVRDALADASVFRLIQELRVRYRQERLVLVKAAQPDIRQLEGERMSHANEDARNTEGSTTAPSYHSDLMRFAEGRTPRRSLHALLLAISEREMQADNSTRHFYQAEGPRWVSMVVEKLGA